MGSNAERQTVISAAASSLMLYRERRGDSPEQVDLLAESQTASLLAIALALHDLTEHVRRRLV